ncbi:hypothetical protein Ddc_00166 [Ditylenchus destructor]|nr:hypothetical protein Ddc_00166 [Ditylenchus destructor]
MGVFKWTAAGWGGAGPPICDVTKDYTLNQRKKIAAGHNKCPFAVVFKGRVASRLACQIKTLTAPFLVPIDPNSPYISPHNLIHRLGKSQRRDIKGPMVYIALIENEAKSNVEERGTSLSLWKMFKARAVKSSSKAAGAPEGNEAG